MAKRAVSVRIRGQEFRIMAEEGDDSLTRVAGYLDETMSMVERKTGTVDSLDLALLYALNLARELVELREEGGSVGRRSRESGVDPDRLEALIELAESALLPASAGQ